MEQILFKNLTPLKIWFWQKVEIQINVHWQRHLFEMKEEDKLGEKMVLLIESQSSPFTTQSDESLALNNKTLEKFLVKFSRISIKS